MTDFFREVDEEVRRDRAIQFWQKYQVWLIGAVVLIVVGTAAWRLYENYRIEAAESAGARYEAALRQLRDGQADAAAAALGALAQDKSKGYATLARLLDADLVAAKDKDAGLKAYEALAADANLAPNIQAAAQLRAAMLLVDREDPKKFELRFAPLAAAGKPFANSYRELLGLAALKQGDYEGAGHWFDEIVVDAAAPPGLRGRAQAFLGLVRAGKLPSQ